MKTKLLLLICLFLVSALVMSGCTGLASGAIENEPVAESPRTPQTPEATTNTPEAPASTPSVPEAPEAIPSTPETPEKTTNTPETPVWNSIPSVTGPVERGHYPSNLEYLTEQEKAEVIRIASEASGRSIDPASVKFEWVGKIDGIETTLPYDTVETGIPNYPGVEGMTFHPAISFLTSPYEGMTIVVDLQAGKALDVRGPLPLRRGPIPNPSPKQ